ncbi:MAG: NAD(P)/FAD-dependent oxidoreductase [Nitrospirae bacterium]|nr:NAD(P)/FAD-dependent oxidoreductase [Nitrospirota bacterium]
MKRYLIIGNGVAGTTAASGIRRTDKEGSITILTDEPYLFYSRIRLIDFLAGEVTEDALTLKKEDWYKQHNIKLLLKSSVADVDKEKKEVITGDGERIGYDRLLLATGAVSFIPPIPGSDKKGVFTLRTLKDAIAIREYADKIKNVVLIGGGVLGLEAGNSLRKKGKAVTVVESFPRLLPRQMDTQGAGILKAQMEAMGFKFSLGIKPKEITGTERAEALMLEDSSSIPSDMIIISAGVRPNAAIARKLGLKIDKGVVVNDRMQTELPDIYAAGDLIEHKGVFYGIWPAAEKQGEIAGINMAGGTAIYSGTTMSNRLKVLGVDLFAAGDIDADGRYEAVVVKDKDNFIYKKLVIKESNIIGAILYGDVKDMARIIKAIENKTDISSLRGDLNKWRLEGL